MLDRLTQRNAFLFAALFSVVNAQFGSGTGISIPDSTPTFPVLTTSPSGFATPTGTYSTPYGSSGSSSSRSFPAGAIAGIVIGFLIILALLVFGVFYVRRRHQRASERTGITVPEACAAGIRAERRIFDLEQEVRVLHAQVASLVAQKPMFVHVHEKEAEAMEESMKAKEHEKTKVDGGPPTYVD
ncbi:hypothetical protein C8F01DRAFT_1147903 [Mycena amicta]|nr:hypothetical protein C8F01DRAFT_1147903 [Mycena amicta]